MSYLGQKMPNTKANIIHCGRDDKLDILGEVIFVFLENSSSSLWMIAPCSKKLGWDLAVVVLKDFTNES